MYKVTPLLNSNFILLEICFNLLRIYDRSSNHWYSGTTSYIVSKMNSISLLSIFVSVIKKSTFLLLFQMHFSHININIIALIHVSNIYQIIKLHTHAIWKQICNVDCRSICTWNWNCKVNCHTLSTINNVDQDFL